MNFIAYNHQGKGNAYIAALESVYKQFPDSIENYGLIKFLLTDHDVTSRGRRLDAVKNAGCKTFFMYPHTARPNIINDIYTPWAYGMTAEFVAAEGHIEVMRRYGNAKPLYAVGWSLCPLKTFTPSPMVRNVLFAPIHPRNMDIDKEKNQATWDRLYKLVKDGAINLTVRYVGILEECGLNRVNHEHVKYVPGGLDQSYAEIDRADVVISHQTFAWMAVARGIPCVMMAEDMPMHSIVRTGAARFAKHWDDYVDLLRFPLDILNYDDTMGLLKRAASTDEDILDWKTRMIGNQFDAEKFLFIVRQYVGN